MYGVLFENAQSRCEILSCLAYIFSAGTKNVKSEHIQILPDCFQSVQDVPVTFRSSYGGSLGYLVNENANKNHRASIFPPNGNTFSTKKKKHYYHGLLLVNCLDKDFCQIVPIGCLHRVKDE